MRRHTAALVALLLVPPSLPALELVTNGGFETDLPPAWQEESIGAATSVARSASYDADPDLEVLAEKGTGDGAARLSQTVVIPSVDVAFSVKARLQATADGAWAAAAVALQYEDHLGRPLGATMILRRTPDCPWTGSDTLHLIPAPDEEWGSYSLHVGDELAYLPGVDPLAVHRVRVSLVATAGGDC